MELPARAQPPDPLAQPTRARLFELLVESGRPLSTDRLAAALDLHPNGIRLHLDRLLEARLVERTKAAGGRGRPQHLWSVSPEARPGGERPTGYLELAGWLGRVVAPGPGDPSGVEDVGRAIGRELVAGDDHGALGAMEPMLAALGFQPQHRREGDEIVFCLRNCPYRDVVKQRQDVVCTLHRGIARGLLDVLDPDATLATFVAKDPETAGCLIGVRSPWLGDGPPPGEEP